MARAGMQILRFWTVLSVLGLGGGFFINFSCASSEQDIEGEYRYFPLEFGLVWQFRLGLEFDSSEFSAFNMRVQDSFQVDEGEKYFHLDTWAPYSLRKFGLWATLCTLNSTVKLH